MEESAMTVREVADYLNVGGKIVYSLAKKGELPGLKISEACQPAKATGQGRGIRMAPIEVARRDLHDDHRSRLNKQFVAATLALLVHQLQRSSIVEGTRKLLSGGISNPSGGD